MLTPAAIARRATPLSGVIFAALLALSAMLVPQPPDLDATPAAISAFFADHRAGVLASNVLGGYAAVFFLIFASWLAAAVRRRGTGRDLLPLMIIAGAVALIPLILGIGVVEMTLAFRPGALSPDTTRALYTMGAFTFNVSAFPLMLFLGSAALGLWGMGRAGGLLGSLAAAVALLHGIAGASVAGSGALAPHGQVYFAAFLGFLGWSLLAAVVLTVAGAGDASTG